MRHGGDEVWSKAVDGETLALVAALWGKSGKDRFTGETETPNLLLQHLFDALAMGEVLWDRFLAPGVKSRLDGIAGGDGRRLLAWLCGLHDVGKASPAFQAQDAELGAAAGRSGLVGINDARGRGQSWRHELASALILRDHLKSVWTDESHHLDWVWPLVAGHHGRFPNEATVGRTPRKKRERMILHGDRPVWDDAQTALLEIVTVAAGFSSLTEAEPRTFPSRADQLLLSGFIIMADWIASDSANFPGVNRFEHVSLSAAHERAAAAWSALGMRPGWTTLPEPVGDVIEQRFGRSARASQDLVVSAARDMGQPGLIVVEAPTGEGKTEAALAAAEILAARSGAEGIYVGMPTQATSDPMFERVREWLGNWNPPLPVVLLHGKRRFNDSWRRLSEAAAASPEEPVASSAEVDHYGMDDELLPVPTFGGICEDCPTDPEGGAVAAAQWFQGHKRGLLAPNGVGTIDHLLFAGSRTRHVMLRYAGLAGKVVILDEVHAADAYMAQFLAEVLRWLGQGRVPVVLLSATLAPDQRRELVDAYLAGALDLPLFDQEHLSGSGSDEAPGYPLVTAVWAADGQAHRSVTCTEPFREPVRVAVEVREESAEDDSAATVAALLEDELSDGGCALVIRNTVGRAQAAYESLVERFGPHEVVLLHSRFTASDRASRTNDLVDRLGPPTPGQAGGGSKRPRRLVVVATQIAEQSFDIDADLLVSDLAPVDLLIQRAGRLHRHERDPMDRPGALRDPRMIITGFSTAADTAELESGSELIYGRHLLLQSLSLVLEGAEAGGWMLPTEVPSLVERCYGAADVVPEAWADDANRARRAQEEEVGLRRARASEFLLARHGQMTKRTLEGLHEQSVGGDAEDVVRVRDGDMGADVVLIVEDEKGHRTLGGTSLGPNGDAGWQFVEEILGDTVRFPGTGRFKKLTELAEQLPTLPAWRGHKLLGEVNVLVLDRHHRARLDRFELRYEVDTGLQVEVTR